MSISESYPGQNVLISYIKKQKTKISYCGFLKNYHDIIVISTFTDNWNKLNSTWTVLDNWNNLDNLWAGRFLSEGKDLPNLKDKLNIERSRYARTSQIYWKRIIEEYKKEKDNHLKKIIEVSAKDQSIPANHSIPVIKNHSSNSTKDSIFIKNYSISISAEDHSIPTNEHSISARNHSKISFKNTNLNNFCNDILQKLDEQSNIHPFYNYDEDSNKIIKNQMDLFTINSKLENNQYTSTKEFENDIRLIFRNCYTYNDMGSEIYCLGEELESAFNRIWTEKIIFHIKQKEKLKRARDTNDADSSSEIVTKQIRILEQNKDKLVYRQVINDACLIASAYENLVAGNIIPFIEILKTFLSTRSKMSLFSTDESVLQAIVESLLPLKYRIPELLLVMDGTKLKGFGHFGYSDIFVLKGIGDNNVSLELKYISLVNLIKLIKIYKNKFNANDLENLDKIIEKENEKVLLKRSYSYWSKEYGETRQTTIGEVLENGVNQLKSYMNVISNGKTINYSSSGIFDERVKITKSNPNKLKGFVILVVGFHRVLWRSVEEIISDYSYDKI
ncbi:uncharacterized protein OCT59_017750 [Rhizophagus irregularis]|uniref:Bromo domain-containing protein n=4 Tax=Rhizophagus irregularis TaxID=588596 RepID=A0A915YX48_9GLOM|nr:Bdf1p [Rhizophagus irregularis DAOM 197198w]UZO25485.1 hypothetical protein OCT59_017750 [Rhizophagus irregularis]CAB4484464.1 unnamed protein product [Rhizophagus irregularis]CAB5349006.1 unnamed protein product [Rhizophagus irregularis]